MIEILKKLTRKVIGPPRAAVGIPYWEKRAKQYGARSFLNIDHTEEGSCCSYKNPDQGDISIPAATIKRY